MATGTLTPGFQLVAQKIQEAAMQHGDVQSALSGAIADHHSSAGSSGNYVNHDGDGESGTATYSSNGAIKQAPYKIGNAGGKISANVDFGKAKGVIPMVKYMPMEALSTWKPEGTLLVESSAHFLETPRLQEAATATYPIK